jgi:small conductance mechanosensitive channel
MSSMPHPSQADVSDLSDLIDTTSVTLTDVILALLVFIAAWVIARMARRGVFHLLGRMGGISEDMRQLASRVTFYFILIIGIGVSMTFLGAGIQPILTASILVAVIAGLALRGIADNFAAGVVLQSRRPIEIGDDIDVLDHSGVVLEINSRSVILEGWDRRRIHIPNSTVLQNPLVNHTAHDTRRSEVEVRLAVSGDVDEAVSAVAETVASVPGVLATPPIDVLFRSIDPERVVIVVRFAHQPAGRVKVTSAVVRAIAVAERSRGRDATVIAPPPAAALTPRARI